MSVDQNKALARRLVDEVINQGSLDVLDDLLAPTYRYHASGMEIAGAEGMKQVFTMLRSAFPDWNETVEDLIADDTQAVFRVTGRGTHRGPFYGVPPTGKQVAMQGTDIVRVEDGRLAEHWAVFDQLGMMQQLGVVPAPEAAAG